MEKIIEALAKTGWVVNKEPGKILHRIFPDFRCGENTWELFINGNSHQVVVKDDQRGNLRLPAYHFAVFWNGWLTGFFSLANGSFAAGDVATEETFCKSIDAIKPKGDDDLNLSQVPGPEAA